jgi:hypothetical protein
MCTTRPSRTKDALGRDYTRFVLGHAKALTSRQASAVNVAVNENPAEPCISLLSYVPSDQHRHLICALLHTGSNDDQTRGEVVQIHRLGPG